MVIGAQSSTDFPIMTNKPGTTVYVSHERGIRIENTWGVVDAKSRRTDTRRRPFETAASCIPNKLAAQFPGRVKLQSPSLRLRPLPLPLSWLCKGRFIPPSSLQLRKTTPVTQQNFLCTLSTIFLALQFYWNFARALDFGDRERLNIRSKPRHFSSNPAKHRALNET